MPARRFASALTLSILLAVSAAYAEKPLPKPQEVFAAYWTSEPGWHTELQLRNNLSAAPLTVTPVLRLNSGEEIPLDAVTIPSNASESVWVNVQLLKHAPNLLGQPGSYGSVVFRFTSISAMNLYATAVPSMQGQPISFPVRAHPAWQSAASLRDNGAGILEGIWWQPRAGLGDILVISNLSEQKTSGTLSLFDSTGKRSSESLILGPRQTQRMAMGELLQQAGLSGSYGGIEVNAPGATSELDAVHFMYDEVGKFSASLEMSRRDPHASLPERAGPDAKQWAMRAPMLALRTPDPALDMPAGTVLQPMILLRNTTAKTISAAIALNWRGDSAQGQGQVKLPEMQLAPFATQQWQIGAMEKQLGIPESAHWALVTLTTNALPDDVIAIASSRDASGRYGMETKFMGGVGEHFAGGELQVDANHNELISVTNSEQKPADALLTLHYDNGAKKYEMEQTIPPGEQMWVNLADLIHNRVADRKGNALPVDVNSVTYDLKNLTPRSYGLMANTLSVDSTLGSRVRSGYANCCSTINPGWDPNPVVLAYGTNVIYGLDATDSCGGDGEDLLPDSSNWTSADPSIAKVTKGEVTAVTTGSTTGSADVFVVEGVGGYCAGQFLPVTAPIGVTPTITGISPAMGLVGAPIGVTITGTGFAAGATVSAGSNISVSKISVASSTQITATFTPTNSSSAGGNQAVTVTVGNSPPSNSKNFYNQVPTHFQRYDQPPEAPGGIGPVITLTNGTAYNLSGTAVAWNVCGVYENFLFDIADQQSTQITNGNVTVTEVFSNVTNPPGPTPATNVPINLASQGMQDIQIYGFTYPTCLANNQYQTLDMTWTVTVGSVVYTATTVVYITKGNFNGTLNVTSSITTP